MPLYSVEFWKDASQRTIRTFCQALAALLIAGPVLNLLEVNWIGVLGTAGLSALVALLSYVGTPPRDVVDPAPRRAANGL